MATSVRGAANGEYVAALRATIARLEVQIAALKESDESSTKIMDEIHLR